MGCKAEISKSFSLWSARATASLAHVKFFLHAWHGNCREMDSSCLDQSKNSPHLCLYEVHTGLGPNPVLGKVLLQGWSWQCLGGIPATLVLDGPGWHLQAKLSGSLPLLWLQGHGSGFSTCADREKQSRKEEKTE